MRLVISGLALALSVALALGPIGCGDKPKKDKKTQSDDDDDDGDKKKKDKKSASASGSTGAPASGGPSLGAAPAATGKYPDIDKLLGPKGQWLPTPFVKLKGEMTPAQAAAVLPGADKVGDFGFNTIPVKDQPGILRYQLHYLGDKSDRLAFAKIQFDPKLTSEEFWNVLLTAMKKKHGDKYATGSPRNLTWTTESFSTVDLGEEVLFDLDDGSAQPAFIINVMVSSD